MKKVFAGSLGLLALAWGHAQAQTANATLNPPAYTAGTQALSQTLGGALRTTIVSGGGGPGTGTAPYIYTPLGYQQITVTSLSTLTVPTGATSAFVTVETAPIRYRDDGSAPSAIVGYPLAVGQQLIYSGSLAAVQLIAQSGTPVVDVLYYK